MGYEITNSKHKKDTVAAGSLADFHSAVKQQHFLPKWLRKCLTRYPALYERYQYWTQVRRLLSYVKSDYNFFKSPVTSRDIYEARDDYEHKAYASGSTLCFINGKIQRLSHAAARDLYISYIYDEIDSLLARTPKLRILEVGCGNCINLVLLKRRYKDRVDLVGHDISGRRIEVAREHFKSKLDEVEFSVCSATDPVPENEQNSFDLVFSMHCLEQIPFAIREAVQGMHQRARHKIVMIEPVFEFARPSQKLFLIYSDFVRTLLPTIHYLGYRIERAEPLPIESSLKNQSSLIIISKGDS